MQRLIDANKLDITTIQTDDYSGNEILDVVLKEDIDDTPPVLTIPDNPTNEDVIKALFPDIVTNEKWKASFHCFIDDNDGHTLVTMAGRRDWLNAPYKIPGTIKENEVSKDVEEDIEEER